MKKIMTMILVLTLVLGLCACGASGSSKEELKVGYAKVNITPELGFGLDGYSDSETRKADTLIEYIYTTCIAFSSGEDTILLFTIDSLSADPTTQQAIRAAVSMGAGIPEDKIFIGATHTHSAPSKADGYREMLAGWCTDAAKQAIQDQAPATMSAATPTYENMTFVRHYKNDDGTYVGANFGHWGNLVGHATESDDNAVLVKFDRADDKKDVLMVNWQSHPDRAREIGYNSVAPSWVGPLRNKVEELTGMQVAYFTGASGNQNPDSEITAEAHGLDWQQYGQKMGELIAGSVGELQPVEGVAIKTGRAVVDAPIDHSWDHMLSQANEVYDLWKSTDLATGNQLAKTYGFSSSYQARAIRSRAAKGAAEQLELNAFSIGELGFITGTYEMFTDASLYLKANSPFEKTFIITGNHTYIPSKDAYEAYRCYESDTGMYAVGTAEMLVDKYLEMLKALKQ